MGKDAAQNGDRVMLLGPAGMIGFYAGRDKIIIDAFGLIDPLLAHLPPEPNPAWRPGHLKRNLPNGYLETRQSGINQIKDPDMAHYYDNLHLIVSGDLFNPRRLEAIVRLNLGVDRPPAVTGK
jgi:arabinofuranosyltransferase